MDPHHRYRRLGSGLLTVLIILVNVISLYLYVEVARQKDKQTIARQDFLVLYTGARLPAAQLYNIDSQRRVQTEIMGKPYGDPAGVLPFVSPPVLIPFLRLIITDDYFASYWRWVAFLIVICLVNGVIVYLITRDVLAAITAVLFIALFGSVLKGQVSPLMTLGLLLWGYFLSRGKDWAAGVSLGMLILKPHLAIALAIPMFFASRKAFAWFAGVGLLAAGISFAFIGTKGVRDFIHIGHLSVVSNDYGFHREEQFNLLALLIRARAGVIVAQCVSWTIFALSIAISSWILLKKADLSSLGLVTVITILAAPHMFLHDLSLLLLPMSAVGERIKHKALAFVPGSGLLLFSWVLPYLLMIILGAWLGRDRTKLVPALWRRG